MIPEELPEAIKNTILGSRSPGPTHPTESYDLRPDTAQSVQGHSLRVPNVSPDNASSRSFGIKSDTEDSEISRPTTSQADSLFGVEQDVTAHTQISSIENGHSPPTVHAITEEIHPIPPTPETNVVESQSQATAGFQATKSLETMELSRSKQGQAQRNRHENWQTYRDEKKLLRIFPINDISKQDSHITIWDYNDHGTSNASVPLSLDWILTCMCQARIGNFGFQQTYRRHFVALRREQRNFSRAIRNPLLFLNMRTF